MTARALTRVGESPGQAGRRSKQRRTSATARRQQIRRRMLVASLPVAPGKQANPQNFANDAKLCATKAKVDPSRISAEREQL